MTYLYLVYIVPSFLKFDSAKIVLIDSADAHVVLYTLINLIKRTKKCGHTISERIRMVSQRVDTLNMTSSGHETIELFTKITIILVPKVYVDYNVHIQYSKFHLGLFALFSFIHMTSSGHEFSYLIIGTKVYISLECWTVSPLVLLNEKLGLTLMITLVGCKAERDPMRNTVNNLPVCYSFLVIPLLHYLVIYLISVVAGLKYGQLQLL